MNRQQRNLTSRRYPNGMTRYTLAAEYLPAYLNWDSVATTNNPEQLVAYLNKRTGLNWTNISFNWDGVTTAI